MALMVSVLPDASRFIRPETVLGRLSRWEWRDFSRVPDVSHGDGTGWLMTQPWSNQSPP